MLGPICLKINSKYDLNISEPTEQSVGIGYCWVFHQPKLCCVGFHAKVVYCDKDTDLHMYSSFKRTSIFLR